MKENAGSKNGPKKKAGPTPGDCFNNSNAKTSAPFLSTSLNPPTKPQKRGKIYSPKGRKRNSEKANLADVTEAKSEETSTKAPLSRFQLSKQP